MEVGRRVIFERCKEVGFIYRMGGKWIYKLVYIL